MEPEGSLLSGRANLDMIYGGAHRISKRRRAGPAGSPRGGGYRKDEGRRNGQVFRSAAVACRVCLGKRRPVNRSEDHQRFAADIAPLLPAIKERSPSGTDSAGSHPLGRIASSLDRKDSGLLI
jgi:hypothetical protein